MRKCPHKWLFLLLLLMTAIFAEAESPYHRLKELLLGNENLSTEKRVAAIEGELENILKEGDFPLINGNSALFLYKGPAKNVKLAGDMSGWSRNVTFNNLEGTDIFYLEADYEMDARLDYQIIVDGIWGLDPLNKKRTISNYKMVSYLEMPEYIDYTALLNNGDYEEGQLLQISHESVHLKESRELFIYLPPGYDKNGTYPTLFFQNGADYIKYGRTDDILNYLISRQLLRPVIAVFVNSKNRVQDYLLNDRYAEYLVKELIPWVKSHYNSSQEKEQESYIIGKYLGGFAATNIVYQYPEYFEGLLSQSGALNFTYERKFQIDGQKFKHAPFINPLSNMNLPMKWYLICGTYEFNIRGYNLTRANHKFYEKMSENTTLTGLELRYYNQGHNWTLWQNTLADGLLWLIEY